MSLQKLRSLREDPVKFYNEFLKRRGEDLYWYQKEYLRCKARVITVLKGRSIGISWASGIKVLHRALLWPEQSVLIVSWNEDQAKQIFNYAKMFLFRSPKLQFLLRTSSSLTMTFQNGSRIDCSGTTRPHADNIRNFHCNLLIVDEAALIYDEMYAAITPTTRGMENAQEIYISTAGRIGSFFHRQFVHARMQGTKQGEVAPDGTAWFLIPSSECPRITQEELQRERERLGKLRFEREYECKWAGAQNQIFTSLPRSEYRMPFRSSKPCVAGLDVGLAESPTVLLILEPVDEAHYRVVNITEWRRASTEEMFPEIMQLLENYNVKRIMMDAEGIGEGLFTLLLGANAPVHGMKIKDKQKNDLIFNLSNALEKGEVLFPKEENEVVRELIFELENYTATPSKSKPGIYKFDSLIGREDYVIALALALEARRIESYQPIIKIV